MTLLFSLQYLSEPCFGNDNNPFIHSTFCLPNPFLFGATPAINNDRSLSYLDDTEADYNFVNTND
jgi:hypothetical protein